MLHLFQVIVKLFLTMIIAAFLTPFVRRLAYVLGAIDKPSARRVNTHPMPTMGGLAIFISFTFATFVLLRSEFPTHELFSIFLASCVIVVTGMIDDIKELTPRQKMLGILIAALIIYFLARIKMTHITLPFVNIKLHLGWLSFPISIFWILAITNAINLIDGLDGLATGIAIIGSFTMGIVNYFFNSSSTYVSIMIFALMAALIGFLPYNFHPAKVFLGDTGSLFIGFMIAVLSLKGLKNVTLTTMAVPILILGVPIMDTFYAIIRRLLNHQPVTRADKKHLHHRLMQLGLTHRQTVLAIYGLSLIFSFIAMIYPLSTIWGNIALTLGVLIALELFIELIGLLGQKRQPLIHLIQHMINKLSRSAPNDDFGSKFK